MANRQLVLKSAENKKKTQTQKKTIAEKTANDTIRSIARKSKNTAAVKKTNTTKTKTGNKKKKSTKAKTVSYYALTRTGYYGFSSTLPLLIIYQIMAFYLNNSMLTGARSGAESWILALFSFLGTPGFILLGAIGASLIVYFYLQKKKKNIPEIKSFYLLMFIESIVYSFFFGAIVMRILKFVIPGIILQTGMPLSKSQAIMMSLGAGYFEELVFRVILYGGILYLVMYSANKIKPKSDHKTLMMFSMIILAVLTSLAFAFAHHLTGEPFSVYAFWFRAISGIIFVILYQLRGFGVAAYTHAFYDLWIVIEAV